MAPTKLLNLAFSSFAILACSFGTTPANAVSISGRNSSSTSGKVGLAWSLGEDPALKNFKTDKVSSIYTWSPNIPQTAKSLGFDPIPMLWGDQQINTFKSLVVKGYATTVLGFNEPDQAGQANMSPQHAADVWRQYIDPLKGQGYSLISPAVTSAPSGKAWLKNFFNACSGCHFDGVAIHWYGLNPQDFIAYITDFHNTFGLPIWPTEFACQSFTSQPATHDQVFNFMDTVTAFMDGATWVPHYFAFGITHGGNALTQLIGPDGQPTALGIDYLN